jgi:hypothetical protein
MVSSDALHGLKRALAPDPDEVKLENGANARLLRCLPIAR